MRHTGGNVMRMWKLVRLGAALLALLVVLLPAARAEDHDPTKSPANEFCDPAQGDVPEPGMQGEGEVPEGAPSGWKCGVNVIGHLEGASGAMAIAGNCAYTGGGADETEEEEVHAGVRVIDVSDPSHPTLVRVLDTGSRELLAARITDDGERGILVTRHRDKDAQAGQIHGRDMLVDVWDILSHGCTDPQFIRTLRFPTTSDVHGDPPGETGGPVHNLTLNRNATKIYGTIPLQEADISSDDPDDWTVRDLHCEISNQHYTAYQLAPELELCETIEGKTWQMPSNSHEASFNPDNSRLYIGSQIPGTNNNAMYILDMNTASGDPRLVSVTEQAPGHSIDYARIGHREFLFHSNEIGGTACIPEEQRPKYVGMGDRVWVLEITEEMERAPVATSEIILAASKFENCGKNGNTGGPTTAYHHVNNPQSAKWLLAGFGPAGFRIFDIREPEHPREVAYFNYGSSAHTKPYIIPDTNQMWVSGAGGFWVLELSQKVVQELGL